MDRKLHRLVLMFALLVVLSAAGCGTYLARFSPPVAHETEVVLREDDFKITQANLIGEASVWYLFSAPLGDERLYSRALGDLYAKASTEIEGSPGQLIHWTADETHLILPIPILARRKVVFRADLMQFTK